MIGSLDGQLHFAITNKRLIRFSYLDVLRVAEPHDYGVVRGQARLLVYQLRASGTARVSTNGWKLLDVGKIQDCNVLPETFPGSRGDAHQRHYVWDRVYARVAVRD